MKEGEEKRTIETFTGSDMSALESALDVLSRAATMVQEEGPKSTELHRRPSNARRKERRMDPIQNEALDMSTSKTTPSTLLRPSVIISSTSKDANTSNWERYNKPQSSMPNIIDDEACSAYDPAIEEHFKRSLGAEKYAAVFRPNGTDRGIGLSVDDHFAKSLGDQWATLRQPVGRSNSPHHKSVPAKSTNPYESIFHCCCTSCRCGNSSSS